MIAQKVNHKKALGLRSLFGAERFLVALIFGPLRMERQINISSS